MSATHRPTANGYRRHPTVALGLLLIAIGGLLLLDRLEVVDAWAVTANWWPLALVGLGLWWLATGSRLTGGIVVTIGLLLLAVAHVVVDADLVGLIFPLFLATIGAGALAAGARMRRATLERVGPQASPTWHHTPTATAIFGDARISVADDGSTCAAVTALAVFGDVEISVPAGWRVVDRTAAMFGTVRIPRNQPTYAEAPVVELHGMAIFGDARVRYLEESADV